MHAVKVRNLLQVFYKSAKRERSLNRLETFQTFQTFQWRHRSDGPIKLPGGRTVPSAHRPCERKEN